MSRWIWKAASFVLHREMLQELAVLMAVLCGLSFLKAFIIHEVLLAFGIQVGFWLVCGASFAVSIIDQAIDRFARCRDGNATESSWIANLEAENRISELRQELLAIDETDTEALYWKKKELDVAMDELERCQPIKDDIDTARAIGRDGIICDLKAAAFDQVMQRIEDKLKAASL